MGPTDDGDDNTEQRYEELCLDLNMDKNSKDDAWISFERTSRNYTLEVRLLISTTAILVRISPWVGLFLGGLSCRFHP